MAPWAGCARAEGRVQDAAVVLPFLLAHGTPTCLRVVLKLSAEVLLGIVHKKTRRNRSGLTNAQNGGAASLDLISTFIL